jgi:PAS domain S-box-containing protein
VAAETIEDLRQRNQDLEVRLDEAWQTLWALRNGEVDAVVAAGPDGDRIYTLQGADEAYRVMVENMTEGALTLTSEGLILFSNEQFASMLQTPLERVIGSWIHDFVRAEDAAMLAAILAGSAAGKAEVRLKKGSATLAPVQISANRLLSGESECVCFVVTDLSEQKRNREILAAERLARSILEQAAGAILVVDPRGRIVRASRAAEEMAAATVLLRDFDSVFHIQPDGAANDCALGEILSMIEQNGSVAGLKATARLPDGRRLDVVVSAGLLTGAHSQRLGCIILLSDVSGIKRAEERLRQSEERLRLIIESAADIGIFTLDAHGYVSSWSRGAACIEGYDEDEIVGQHFSVFYTEEDRRSGVPESLLRQAANGIAHEEGWRVRKSGALFWADVTVNVLHAADGFPRGFSNFVRDCTEQQNAVAERARLVRELEEKNRELERSNGDLEQFAYAASHDLQEPLRMVGLSAELLVSSCANSSAESSEFLTDLTAGLSRMRSMIYDILAFSKVGRPERRAFRPVDLNEAVKCALRNLAAAIEENEAEVVFGPLPTVTGDFNQISLVFQNLIGNAIKYRADNKPRIAIVAAHPVFTTDGDYRVSVRDNGIGIGAEYHKRIFGVFKRLHSASEIPGTGIGLAICQRVVERHGGRIWVESEPGEGSVFVFTLPAAEKVEKPAPRLSGSASVPGGNE